MKDDKSIQRREEVKQRLAERRSEPSPAPESEDPDPILPIQPEEFNQ